MKNFVKENKYIILTILILSSIMFIFINQKQGFHEDEMFSYGSSNYRYDNVYRSFGYAEANQDTLYKEVLKGNIVQKFKNVITFIKNQDSFPKDEILDKEIPIWKTKGEALEYLTIQKNDIFNYGSVYVNQVRDVHPPLFYFFTHFFSTIFYNSFSKYIIFSLNLLFFIGTLIVISKIMKLLEKKELTIPTMILYGASIGAISTVMFQRMYMMLTFFSILYLFLTIKLIKNDFKISKKLPWILTIICGFLSQYYFCIYIALIFIIITICLLTKKRYKDWFDYLKVHVLSAFIGILLYPSSIEDIFFSYRGIGSNENHTKTFAENIIYYIDQIVKLFGLKNILLLLLIPILIIFSYKVIKKQLPKIENKKFNLVILFLPIVLFILVISKISPYLGEDTTSRYTMLLFPVISITIMYLLTFIFKNIKNLSIISLIIIILISGYSLFRNKPVFLYQDYNKVMDIAKANSNKYFVYIYDNSFTHLSSMPEFTTYDNTMIININKDDLKVLDNKELNSNKEFILCIKGWLNEKEILSKVLINTGYTNYEKLLELNGEIESYYYKIMK